MRSSRKVYLRQVCRGPAKSHGIAGKEAPERVNFSLQGGNERGAVCDDAQERFTRLKTLGADYTEEVVVACRIARGPRLSRQPRQRSGKVSMLFVFYTTAKFLLFFRR